MQANFEINIGMLSDTGQIRSHNEDYTTFYIPKDKKELAKNGSLFLVADGVGGAAKGEVASRFACDTVMYEYYNMTDLLPAERLARALRDAGNKIFNHTQEEGNYTRMATTMVAALVLNNKLIIAHVGDSRLYLLRGGRLEQITQDHSVVAEMVRSGSMTPEEASVSKIKNRLSRSIGGEPNVRVELSPPIPLQLADRILICSDGLTRYLDGERLQAAIQRGSVNEVAKTLVKYANRQGGADNVTVMLLEMVEKATVRIKKPVMPQAPPEELGWDEMETEYAAPKIPKKLRVPVWAYVGGAAVVLVMLFFPLFRRGGKEPEATQMVIPTPIALTGSKSIPTSISKDHVNSIAETQVADSGNQPASEANGNDPDKSSTEPTADMSNPTESPSHQWECVYKVEEGDTLITILKKFRLDYYPNENYYYYESCAQQEGKWVCNSKKEIPNHNVVGGEKGPKWIVIDLSTVNDDGSIKDLCEPLGFILQGGIDK